MGGLKRCMRCVARARVLARQTADDGGVVRPLLQSKLFTCIVRRMPPGVYQGSMLDGNGCVTMDPANESPSVLNGMWSPDGTMDNPGIEAYEGTMF